MKLQDHAGAAHTGVTYLRAGAGTLLSFRERNIELKMILI
jgi:hypothetical protein